MKKWVVTLSIFLLTSIIGSGVTLARLFNDELQPQEIYTRYDLTTEMLKSLEIDTDTYFEIKVTEGQPYVELYESKRGIYGKNQVPKVEITEKDAKTIVKIRKTKEKIPAIEITQTTEVTFYLPKQDMITLKINNNYLGRQSILDLKDLNIRNVEIKGDWQEVALRGRFEDIFINASVYGNVSVDSLIPVNFTMKGNGNVDLKGAYQSIDLENLKYIQINSTTPTDVNMKNIEGEISINGALKDIKIDAEVEKIMINTSMIPEGFWLEGKYHNLILILPTEIEGYSITAHHIEDSEVYSEFEGTQVQRENEIEKITFGVPETKIYIEEYSGQLKILKK